VRPEEEERKCCERVGSREGGNWGSGSGCSGCVAAAEAQRGRGWRGRRGPPGALEQALEALCEGELEGLCRWPRARRGLYWM
jgi:hypothetical protein